MPVYHWQVFIEMRSLLVLVALGLLYRVIVHEADSGLMEDVLRADHKPTPGRAIMFFETSRPHQTYPGLSRNLTVLELTARQACAVESAALHNTNSDVFVMFSTATYRNSIAPSPLMEAVLTYPNVHLRTLDLWTFAADTPIYSWLQTGQLFTSKYLVAHTSDLLRMLALWRWGGTYLDTDVVVLRNIERLKPNYIGVEHTIGLNNAVMNLAHDGIGHEVATKCLLDFQQNYLPQLWAANGPRIMTRVIGALCGTNKVELMLRPNWSCLGFQIFEENAFYAIYFNIWKYLFDPVYLELVLRLVNESYVVHAWNNYSKDYPIKVGSNSAYEKLAEKHCPKAYAAAGEYF